MTEALHFLPRPDQRDFLVDFIAQFGVRFAEEDATPDHHACSIGCCSTANTRPDLADAYLVVLCSMNRRWKVWSYDAEFYHIWRRLDGSVVPMATAQG